MRACPLLLIAAINLLPAQDFIPNIGQLPPGIQYAAKTRGVVVLAGLNGDIGLRSVATGVAGDINLAWIGANPSEWTPGHPTGRHVRYCTPGLPQTACAVGTPTFSSVRRPGLFAGVDLILHTTGGAPEYDLEVRPGGQPESIQFEVQGGPLPVLDSSGRLVVGDLVQWHPIAYQEQNGTRLPVECAIRQLSARVFGFTVIGPFRHELPLIIDPVIESGLVVTGSEPGEDRVLGQNTYQTVGMSRRLGTTNWDVFVTSGFNTTYWGGDGDEQVLGFDFEPNNGIITVVGSTSSRDVFTTGLLGRGTAFHGGATDAFFLEFRGVQLAQAALLGGPGADSLHDVRRTTPSGSFGDYLIVGDTDNPNWTGFRVEGQARGGTDAIAGWFGPSGASLVVTGGSANDTAKVIRASGDKSDEWIVAGETDSLDFANKSRPGQDLWVARLSSAPLRWGAPQAWGGSGEDRLAGLVSLTGHGVMLAGSTTSTDLPVADSPYNGGASDGFVAWLDPVDYSPRLTRYLGGPGTDEILALRSWSNDLFLVGFTDSLTLSVPGLMAGSDPAGRQDALFIHTDPFLNPMVAYRAGGTGNDRFTSVAPTEWGVVDLAGWSDSRPWLAALQPFPPQGDSTAGFVIRLRYAVVGTVTTDVRGTVSDPPILTLGRDLQMPLPVFVGNEPGTNEVLIARSLDPSKLRLAGEESVLLYRGGTLTLEALAEEGEVDVLISGRTPNPSPVSYPTRKLRIRLAPSRAFLEQPIGGVLSAMQGNNFEVNFAVASLLPNGAPGQRRQPRAGVELAAVIAASDAAAVAMVNERPYNTPSNRYRVDLRALREGTFTLTLQTMGISPAPGQQLQLRVVSPTAPPQSPWLVRAAVMTDHIASISFYLADGDRLQFTSEDPRRVSIAVPGVGSGNGTTVSRQGDYQLNVSAHEAGGSVGVRVVGTRQGQPVDERLEVLPWPYAARVSNFWGRNLAPGALGSLTLGFAPQGTLPPGVQTPFQSIAPGSPLTNLQIRFSDPRVATLVSRTTGSGQLYITFRAAQVGRTSLELPNTDLPTPLLVEVVPANVNYGAELRVPTATTVNLFPISFTLATGSEKQVRVRVSDPLRFGLNTQGTSMADVTIDLSNQRSLPLEVNAPVGSTSSLLISAPGMDEISVPIRVIEKILTPQSPQVRLNFDQGAPEVRGTLSYSIAGYDPNASLTAGPRVVNLSMSSPPNQKVRVLSEPSGVCEFPAEVDLTQFSLSVPFVCRNEGQVSLTLQGGGTSDNQSLFKVLLTVYRPPAPPFYPGVKLSIAAGTQIEFLLFRNGQRFNGTLTSSNPQQLKLAPSPTAPGQATLATGNVGPVFLQAFHNDGTVWLKAEAPDGNTEEIPVFLYPATMAVRLKSNPTAPQIRLPADASSLAAIASPYAFDPGSGLLLPIPEGLALRAGTDPFFLKPVSSNEAVAAPLPPNPLFSELDRERPVNLKINGKGGAVVTVEQPPGFFPAPSAGLRLTVVERGLQLRTIAAAPGLQSQSSITFEALSGDSNSSPGNGLSPSLVTLTSLSPAKLLLSADSRNLGSSVLSLATDRPFLAQVLPGAQPGERLSVRLTSPGFADSIAEILVSSAVLASEYTFRSPLLLQPGVASALTFRYGPADPFNNDRIVSYWSGGPLPGSLVPITVRTLDPSILALGAGQVTLDADGYARLSIQGLRPGTTELLLTAPEGIANRVENTTIEVGRWIFPSTGSFLTGARGLWAPLAIRNPRNEPTLVTVRSDGQVPLAFATTTASLPVTSLQLTIAPREQTMIFWTALATGSDARILVTAPDFVDQELRPNLTDPQVVFQSTSPLSLAVANRTASLTLRLFGRDESPLSTAPIQVEVRSSDPRILRVLSSPVEFKTGQATANVTVEMVAPGTVVLSALPPANFSSAGQTGTVPLTVIVR